MKKTVAIIISVLLIISLLPMAAFAGEKSDEVKAKMEAARDKLYGEKTEFIVPDESYDFLLFLKAGGDGEKFKKNYIKSVKDAFEAGTMNTADRIGLAACCLDILGEKTDEFELNDGTKVNLIEEMEKCGTNVDSPYNYFFLLPFSSETFTQQIMAALKADYTKGQGYDYWGYGSDNSANFAAMSTDDELVADAVNVVEKAKTDKGYYYLADYGTDANGNSTASALFMYSILENQEKADEVYALLVENFATENGGFAYALGGDADNYATRDALKALIYYNIISQDEPTPDTTTSQTATQVTTGSRQQSTPATGDSLAACGIAGVAVMALGIVLVTRKKSEK